jgi:hypothetical protein
LVVYYREQVKIVLRPESDGVPWVFEQVRIDAAFKGGDSLSPLAGRGPG